MRPPTGNESEKGRKRKQRYIKKKKIFEFRENSFEVFFIFHLYIL